MKVIRHKSIVAQRVMRPSTRPRRRFPDTLGRGGTLAGRSTPRAEKNVPSNLASATGRDTWTRRDPFDPTILQSAQRGDEGDQVIIQAGEGELRVIRCVAGGFRDDDLACRHRQRAIGRDDGVSKSSTDRTWMPRQPDRYRFFPAKRHVRNPPAATGDCRPIEQSTAADSAAARSKIFPAAADTPYSIASR